MPKIESLKLDMAESPEICEACGEELGPLTPWDRFYAVGEVAMVEGVATIKILRSYHTDCVEDVEGEAI